MNKIGFVVTTFLRDELLYKSIQSIVDNHTKHWEVIIVDQGNDSEEKTKWLSTLPSYIHYYKLNFDCGLSKARNYGVSKAKLLECDYCFISSDSFLFNSSIKKLDKYTDILENTNYSLIGFELIPSTCGWEAKLNLISGESFELDFIDKNNKQDIYDIDICRNIFIAKTNSLLAVKWDENLLLGEHEDFFYRYKDFGYKCGWTNNIMCNKLTDRPPEYKIYRQNHFRDGIIKLREKYKISGWVTYKNLERAKNYIQSLDK